MAQERNINMTAINIIVGVTFKLTEKCVVHKRSLMTWTTILTHT
jgi:hypothetical protein